MKSTFAATASALMLAALTSGCTGTHAPAQPSSPSSSSSPDLDAAARQAVLASYTGMWDDFAHAGLTADPTDPTLAHHSTGAALHALDQGLVIDKNRGLVSRGRPLLSPSVTTLTPQSAPTNAVVTDCSDTTNFQVYSKTTGKLVDSGPSGRRLITAHLIVQDGTWKVSELTMNNVGSC